MASTCLVNAMNVKPRLPLTTVSPPSIGGISPALAAPFLPSRKGGSRLVRQNLQLTCSLGRSKSQDHAADINKEDATNLSLHRLVVLPALASIVLGSVSPAFANEIDWAALLNPAETIAMPEEPKAAEPPPSYMDLLGRLKKDSEEKEEVPAPEAAAEAPAPLSLFERQQKRAQELREKTMKAQAEREAAARAVAEKRAAERAEQQAREEAERAERARVAAEKEAAARAEREAAIARSKAVAPAPAAPAKVDKPATPVKEAPQQKTAGGKKKTHGFLPLFLAQFLLFGAYGGGIYVLFFAPEKEVEKYRKPLAEAADKLLELATQALPVVESAVSKGQELAVAAAPVAAKAIEAAKPVAAKAIEAAKPVAAQAIEASKPLLKQAQEKAQSLAAQAKENIQKSGN